MIREKLKETAAAVKREVQVYKLVHSHPRTPWLSRILLGLAVAYLLSPIDLIPDFIPVLGHLDDLILIPGLVWLSFHFIPDEIIEECRNEVST